MTAQSRLIFSVMLLVSTLAWCTQLFAVDLSKGRMLSISCAACHGTGGRSPGAIPAIRGKSAAFIETTLKQFRSGKRPSTVMGRHAKGYSDAEIKLIAEYFGKLK